MVDMRSLAAAAGHAAASAVPSQRRGPQLPPMSRRVIAVSRQLPIAEARHIRANEICVEAIRLARRDGKSAEERGRIYDREVARLMQEEFNRAAAS